MEIARTISVRTIMRFCMRRFLSAVALASWLKRTSKAAKGPKAKLGMCVCVCDATRMSLRISSVGLFGSASRYDIARPCVSNVKWMANSPYILESCHPSLPALHLKKASQSRFGNGWPDDFRGWMAVKHGVHPEYAARAPCIPASRRLRWPTWRRQRCLSYE